MVGKRKKRHVMPAELLEIRFGGSRELGRMLGRNETIIAVWKRRGGHVPVMGKQGENMHTRIMALAKEKGIRLTADELINGAMV